MTVMESEISIEDLTNYLVAEYLPSVSEKAAKKFSDMYFIYNPYDPLEKNPELKFSLEEVVKKYFDDHNDESDVGGFNENKDKVKPEKRITVTPQPVVDDYDDDSKLLNSIVYHFLLRTGHSNFAEEFRTELCLDKDDDWNNNISETSVEDVVRKYLHDQGLNDNSDESNPRKYKDKIEPSHRDSILSQIENDDSKLLNSIVYHYLKTTGHGNVAEEFRAEFCFGLDLENTVLKISMEDVVKKYSDDHNKDCIIDVKKNKGHKNRQKSDQRIKFRNKVNRFSAEEDKILLKALKSIPPGEKVSSSVLKDLRIRLNRDRKSVVMRLWKLEKGRPERTVRKFSLEEDKIIIDESIQYLKQCKYLKLIEFERDVVVRLAASFKRRDTTVISRWYEKIKVWLLQYYNKTLNLEIRPMLANAIADNFQSREIIDWEFLRTFPEFVGHTKNSLKNQYNNIMLSYKKRFTDKLDATVQEIATYATISYKPNKLTIQLETRQQEIIEYFEEQVRLHNIKDFI